MQTQIFFAVFLGLCTAMGGLGAQSLSGPSDLPPPGFGGAEYVDGRGCVFTRARIDGTVTWVPRTNAARQQVCGQAPTLAPVQAAQVRTDIRPAPRPAVSTPVAAAPRVVARHVYDTRQNTIVSSVPRGYRPAWTDGRLNPRRSEMSFAPSVVRAHVNPPRGYTAGWGDGRLNPHRGSRSAAGDAATDRIWDRGLPRKLRPVPTDVPVVRIERPKRQRNTVFWEPRIPDQPELGTGSVSRLSSRSEPARFRPRADR